MDLVEHNGDDSYELPVPATYVIDGFGVIRYAFMDTDYRQRVELDTLLAAVRTVGDSTLEQGYA